MLQSRKKIVLVDLDMTLAKMVDGIAERWKELYPEFPAIKEAECDDHDVLSVYVKRYGQWAAKAVDDIYAAKDFYLQVGVYEGAKEALEEMIAADYEVFICTATAHQYAEVIVGKYAWIERNLGPTWVLKTILTPDKTIITADYLIDDKPSIEGANPNPAWQHIYFDQPYNRTEAPLQKKRITHWKDWKQIITAEQHIAMQQIVYVETKL